jgi:hypothetical protein
MATKNTLRYIETGKFDHAPLENNFTAIYTTFDKILFTANADTANGDGSESTIVIAHIPYKKWTVINTGFVVTTNFASTIAEVVYFGIGNSDVGAKDVDLFGILSQDVTGGKNLAAGDCVQRSNLSYFVTPDAPANAGTHVWSNSGTVGFNIEQTKQGFITVSKANVGSSTGTIRAWVLVQIGDV